MDNPISSTLALVVLHSSGFTHRDLHNLFESMENYSETLEDLLSQQQTPTPWMTSERRTKILAELATIDRIGEITAEP